MDKVNSNIDELQEFINDTRQGKYSEDACNIEQLQDVRYEYEVIEDVNRASESVILYGLSY